MTTTEPDSVKGTPSNECPLSLAALFLSSKWDLVVIYNLLERPLRFSELRERISKGLRKDLTPSSLTRILRKLEVDGIIEKTVTTSLGEGVEVTYGLTTQGKDLEPTLRELRIWGLRYSGKIPQQTETEQ